MRLHRFFIEDYLRNKKEVVVYDDELIHQWKDVFRLKAGNRIMLLDNTGYEYAADIFLLAKGKAELKIIETNESENMPIKDIWLFMSLIKKDNFEWVLEKGTELGISHFVPVLTDRTEKKDLNMERAIKIVKEASEQSGRGKLPEVNEITEFKDIFDFATENSISLTAFNLEGNEFNKKAIESKTGIVIGPEGGWSDKEIQLFTSKEIPVYTLGKQVLRAETAAIAVSSLLLL